MSGSHQGAQRASIQRSRSIGLRSAFAIALLAFPTLVLGHPFAAAPIPDSNVSSGVGLVGTTGEGGVSPSTIPGDTTQSPDPGTTGPGTNPDTTTPGGTSPGKNTSTGTSRPAGPPVGSFVATNGSDSNPGTLASPWRSVQHAANVAHGAVWLRAGTYSGGVTVTRSGITFAGYPGEHAIINGGPFGLSFFKVSSGAVSGLTIQNANSSGGAGVLISSSSHVTVANSVIHNNKNFGVRTWNSTNSTIRNNQIYKNQEGVRISYASGGIQVLNNRIYSQDSMFDNETGGGVGITFLKSTGKVLASGNQLWLNRAFSHRYGYDGGAFEIYGASDVTITGNIAWNNKDVMETGTSGPACNNITFTRNIGYAASTVSGWSRGLIIACASNSLFANNTLDGFDISDISVVDKPGYTYQGSLSGLRIENNILRSKGSGVFYFDHLPSSVVIDYNLIWNQTGGSLVYVVGKSTTSSFATLKSWLGGRMAHGINADPRFYNGTGHDYRLQAGSAAINHGASLGSVTPYAAGGPDIGRWEMR